jgi:Ca2+-binding EF-hand superfamily protein
MKSMTFARTVLVALALASASAAGLAQDAATPAQQNMRQQFMKRFNAADTNGDGKLTRDEAKAGMPFVYKHFDDMDTAKKGFVTVEDIAAYGAQRRRNKQGGDASDQ